MLALTLLFGFVATVLIVMGLLLLFVVAVRTLAVGEAEAVCRYSTSKWDLLWTRIVTSEHLALSPDGRILAHLDFEERVWAWSTEQGGIFLSVRFDPDEDAFFPLLAPVFSADGSRLIGGTDKPVISGGSKPLDERARASSYPYRLGAFAPLG